MKALSIRQPWAWLILHARKDIENRAWQTTFRGRVLIHASKGMTRCEWEEAREAVSLMLADAGEPKPVGGWFPNGKDLERGGIVGSVEIVDCVSASTSPWFGGPYGFVLCDPKILPFHPCRGALGFFEVQEWDQP